MKKGSENKEWKSWYKIDNQGFVATGVLYSLIGIIAVILFMTISNLATTRKIMSSTAEEAKSLLATYEVIYDANGGLGTMSSSVFESGKPHALKANSFSKVGYSFNGWGLTSISTSNLYPDRALINNQGSNDSGVRYLPVNTRRTIHLYAAWKPKTFTITFNPNTGTVNPTSKTVEYDKEYGTLPTPTKTGCDFAGWYTTASNEGSQITSSTKVTITADQTLYARWTTN